MCRLLGYFGPGIQLDRLLYKPEHSLIVQSYQPREMTSGVVNADGFGLGWYHQMRETDPFIYKNTLPIWSDINLPHLSRYVESGCILGSIRSATAGQAVDLSNCPPFGWGQLLGVHNGFIEKFRSSLGREMRDRLTHATEARIGGSTDSEYIIALVLDNYHTSGNLTEAVHTTLTTLTELANTHQVRIAANLILSDGNQLVASRFATTAPAPSLYWLRDDPTFPNAIIIASEPLFAAHWHSFPESSISTVGANLDIHIYNL
ncbi:MAG: ergothioneine biosynthesis protein EgtC [Oscillatoriaceae cyanobacterium]